MNRTDTQYIVWHCSATPADWDIGAAEIKHLHTAPKTEAISWGQYNLHGKAWSDIGYGLVIPRNGIIEIGRGIEAVGAHVKGYNRVSVGVCLVGGVSADGKGEDNFTEEQWRAADMIAGLLKAKYPTAIMLGHRDLAPDVDGDGVVERHEWTKECPCFSAMERWP